MKCTVCRGACCEELVVGPVSNNGFPMESNVEFLAARGEQLPGFLFALPCRCPQLTADGLCGLQETTKPVVCLVFPAGGEDCLSAVRRRRTPEQFAAIRDEGDPWAL